MCAAGVEHLAAIGVDAEIAQLVTKPSAPSVAAITLAVLLQPLEEPIVLTARSVASLSEAQQIAPDQLRMKRYAADGLGVLDLLLVVQIGDPHEGYLALDLQIAHP